MDINVLVINVGNSRLSLGVFLAGVGRLISISKVGLPMPAALWLGYLVPELLLPFIIALAHRRTA